MTAHRPFRQNYKIARPQTVRLDRIVQPDVSQRGPFIAAAIAAYEAGDIEGALVATLAALDLDADWADGHRAVAELLWQCRTPAEFEAWLEQAVRQGEGHFARVATCLRMLSDAGFHGTVLRLLPEVTRWTGEHLFFTLLGAVAASETGDSMMADALFTRAAAQGGRLSLPHVQHLLKCGDVAQAASLAEAVVADQPDNQTGWALLSTAWRMLGDPRHGWLVDRPGLVRCIDIDASDDAIDALAARLRTLHVARTHPFDRSLRGGTQTAGNILERQEPEIVALRMGLLSAIHRYVASLPAEDMRHPVLGRPRENFYLSDSWSVRLLDGGHHVNHIHPVGTLSAAFYVALPPASDDDPNAGWLTIGAPPTELGTGLPPLYLIKPKKAQLVLFPSFLWHGTLPFPAGERMSVAFDTILTD